MSAYWYSAKTKLNVALAYRFEVLSGLIANLIVVVATVFFWRGAYAHTTVSHGLNLAQMETYSVLTGLLGTLYSCQVEGTLGERIRDGNVALDFLKPVRLFGLYFAQDMGVLAGSFVLKTVPLFLFSLLFVRLLPPVSPSAFLLFLVCAVLSYLILWLLSAITGLITFWAMSVGPVGYIKDVIQRILSGSIIPIWFFPAALQTAIGFTPFVYTYQLTAGVYIGRSTVAEAVKGALVQLVWIAVLYVIFFLLQKKSARRVMIQGG